MQISGIFFFGDRPTDTTRYRSSQPELKNSGNHQQTVEDAGCHKCNHCKVACPVIKETRVFKSTNTRRTYPIRQKINCDSAFVVYLATCQRCQGQYVGKSETPFKRRHSNHKQEIKRRVGGLGQHYGGNRTCSYQDISFILIEQVEVGNKGLLANRERFWQHQLRAFIENGGNGQCIRKEF